jgi:cell division protein FtsN
MAEKKGKGKPSSPNKKYRLQLTRKGVWFWIVSIFFISAWMFVLGILVGRGTAPVRFDIHQIQKELAELKKKTLKEALHRFKIDKETLEDKPDLDFYEALKTSKEEISLPEQPVKEGKTPPPPEAAEAKALSGADTAEPEPVRRKASASEPKKNPTPAAPAGQSDEQLSIQVASVKEGKDADRLVAQLKSKGFPAYRTLAKIPGKGIWFRVRVGPYKNRGEADRTLRRLKDIKLTGFLVKY